MRRDRARARAGWALAAPAAAMAAARLTGRDAGPALIAAQSITGAGLALATGALGLAGLARRRGLATVAAPLVALNLRWVWPELPRRRAGPGEAGTGPGLRLLTSNLYNLNAQTDDLALEIMAVDADVVLLQELSYANLPALQRHGVVDAYPYRLIAPRVDAFGTAILSRLPMSDEEVWNAAQIPMARATVMIQDRPVRVYCVHPRAPFGPRGVARWRSQLASLRQVIREEPRPLIVAGDFNATSGHRPFREVVADGLRDAHVDRGRGWVTTWPSDLPLLPAVARVDHVLVSPEFAVVSAQEGRGTGSDHRPLIVDLALRPSR